MKPILDTKRARAASALRLSGLGWMLRRLQGWQGLLVLNYHRVGDGALSRWDEDIYSADEEAFDAQLRFFKREFDVIRAEDLPGLRGRRGRFVQITFDDGYIDNYEVAFPILRSNGLSGTFFVTTNFIDHGTVPWWEELAWMVRGAKGARIPAFPGSPGAVDLGGTHLDAVRAMNGVHCKLTDEEGETFMSTLGELSGTGRAPAEDGRRLWMTWDMLREMRRGGMTIGGHTMNHVLLSRFPREEQLREIAGCKARIEAELGEPIRTFSYPYGGKVAFNDDSRWSLAEAGFDVAYSYYGGFQRRGEWDRFDVKRVRVEAIVGLDLVKAIATVPQILA
jgi:peptidoglycan/xylan/chitin deacetylase (PgdA/CDA1 family)